MNITNRNIIENVFKELKRNKEIELDFNYLPSILLDFRNNIIVCPFQYKSFERKCIKSYDCYIMNNNILEIFTPFNMKCRGCSFIKKQFPEPETITNSIKYIFIKGERF